MKNKLYDQIDLLLDMGDIRLVANDGIRCQIGEYEFYFAGSVGDEYENTEEFLKEVGWHATVEMIWDVLKSKESAEENCVFEDEYGYYRAVLNLKTAYRVEKMWDELTDVPFDEDDDGELRLAERFWRFPVGTRRTYIWKWFDDMHYKGVEWLLYDYRGVGIMDAKRT